MTVTECRRCPEPVDSGDQLCLACFARACDDLAGRILAAPTSQLDAVYLHGMAALGEDVSLDILPRGRAE